MECGEKLNHIIINSDTPIFFHNEIKDTVILVANDTAVIAENKKENIDTNSILQNETHSVSIAPIVIYTPTELKKKYKNKEISKNDLYVGTYNYYNDIFSFDSCDTIYKDLIKSLKKLKSNSIINDTYYLFKKIEFDYIRFNNYPENIKLADEYISTLKELKEKKYTDENEIDSQIFLSQIIFEENYQEKVEKFESLSISNINSLYNSNAITLLTKLKFNFIKYYDKLVEKPKSFSYYNAVLKNLELLFENNFVDSNFYWKYKYNIYLIKFNTKPHKKSYKENLDNALENLYNNNIIDYSEYSKNSNIINQTYEEAAFAKKQKNRQAWAAFAYGLAAGAQAYNNAMQNSYNSSYNNNNYTSTTPSIYTPTFSSSRYNSYKSYNTSYGIKNIYPSSVIEYDDYSKQDKYYGTTYGIKNISPSYIGQYDNYSNQYKLYGTSYGIKNISPSSITEYDNYSNQYKAYGTNYGIKNISPSSISEYDQYSNQQKIYGTSHGIKNISPSYIVEYDKYSNEYKLFRTNNGIKEISPYKIIKRE